MIMDFQDTMFLLVSTRLKESFRESLEEMSKRGDDAEEGDSQEEAKGASKLTDQRVEGKYQDQTKWIRQSAFGLDPTCLVTLFAHLNLY